MLRVLFWHMKKQYSMMTPDEKEFFDAPMETVCPLGSRFNKIYFYKFLDQYTCLQGGAGQLRKQGGKSVNLLKRFSGAGANYRAGGGIEGSYITPELIAALKTLGISTYSHGAVNAYPRDFSAKVGRLFKNQDNQFVICHISDNLRIGYIVFSTKYVDKDLSYPYPRTVKIGSRMFDIASAGISVYNENFKGRHSGHTMIGYVDGLGKGYLFDSNQMSNYAPCDWWDPKKLEKVIRGPFVSGRYEQYSGDNITTILYNNFVYVRRTFASQIALSCRLKARRLNFNTRPYLGYTTINQVKNIVNTKYARGELSQAERVKIIKNYSVTKFNTTNYMKYKNTTQLMNSIKNLPQERQNKIIKNYKKLINFKVRNYLNTPNNVLNYQVQAGTLTVGERQKIANAKKLIITFEFLKQMTITKNTISNFEDAGYIVTEATKRKVKKLFSKSAGSLTPSPNPNRTGFTPSPPRKKPPSRSNLDGAKSAVAKLKTIVARKEYKKTRATNMSTANWTALGRYINTLNYEKRKKLENARQLKKKVKN